MLRLQWLRSSVLATRHPAVCVCVRACIGAEEKRCKRYGIKRYGIRVKLVLQHVLNHHMCVCVYVCMCVCVCVCKSTGEE
jgi:hypothetical protein